MVKVVIMGAGIGGLAAAHELSKNQDYEIHIVERETIVGGQARSDVKPGVSLSENHTELCWHAISSGYVNFLQILSEVMDEEGIKAISHIRPLTRFIYAMDNKTHVETNNSFITRVDLINEGFKKLYGEPVPLVDQIKLKLFLLQAITICDERVSEFDNITWADYIADISPQVKRWILDSTSIYLGMDYKKISVAFVMQLIRHNALSPLVDSSHVFYSFDGPMNGVFLNVWKNYLERRGVVFHMSSRVVSLNRSACGYSIKSMRLMSNDAITEPVSEKELCADIFINAMGCESLAKLYPVEASEKFRKLSALGHQIQTQVLFYFPKPLLPHEQPTVLIMPDTPWFLMARIENTLWKSPFELLSVGIGIWDVKGELCGKVALECTRDELAQECWHQLQKSQHGLSIGAAMPRWDIWHSFYYDAGKREITTYEPKFSNNAGTLALRPTVKDNILNNLYHATAYTRTNMNVYNMESAAEAGIKAARSIQHIAEPSTMELSPLISFCRTVDSALLRLSNLFKFN